MNTKSSFWSKKVSGFELLVTNGHPVVSAGVKIRAGPMDRDICGTVQVLDYAQRARYKLKNRFICVPPVSGSPSPC